MPRLVSREKAIPFGFKFYIAPLKWNATPNASFDSVVRQAIGVLAANPHVAQQLGWDLNYDSMSNRVDEYNALMMQSMNYTAYYTGRPGGAPVGVPFIQGQIHYQRPIPGVFGLNVAANKHAAPQAVARSGNLSVAMAIIKKLAAGAATLMEWEEAGLPHVDQVKADSRAGTCAGCPKNDSGKKLTDYFTVPLSELIKKRMERLSDLELKTPHDEKLMVCAACYCPLRTKVWMPIDLVLKRITDADRAELNQDNPKCWILSETNA